MKADRGVVGEQRVSWPRFDAILRVGIGMVFVIVVAAPILLWLAIDIDAWAALGTLVVCALAGGIAGVRLLPPFRALPGGRSRVRPMRVFISVLGGFAVSVPISGWCVTIGALWTAVVIAVLGILIGAFVGVLPVGAGAVASAERSAEPHAVFVANEPLGNARFGLIVALVLISALVVYFTLRQ